MALSKKETILAALVTRLKQIKKGTTVKTGFSYIFNQTVSYVDRQYLEFEEEDVLKHPKPWLIVNNNGEDIQKLVSMSFENKIFVQVVGYVEIDKKNPELDSLMNSLQLDIILAILTEGTLFGTCDYVLPRGFNTVDEMVYPCGGFVLNLEIVYTFRGLEF